MNPFQLGAHKRFCVNNSSVEENPVVCTPIVAQVPMVQVPMVQVPMVQVVQVPMAPTPVVAPVPRNLSIWTLCRRKKCPVDAGDELLVTSALDRTNKFLICDFVPLQKKWKEHIQQVYHMFDPHFWTIFDAIKLQAATTIDSVLTATSNLLQSEQVSAKFPLGGRWPRQKRTL